MVTFLTIYNKLGVVTDYTHRSTSFYRIRLKSNLIFITWLLRVSNRFKTRIWILIYLLKNVYLYKCQPNIGLMQYMWCMYPSRLFGSHWHSCDLEPVLCKQNDGNRDRHIIMIIIITLLDCIPHGHTIPDMYFGIIITILSLLIYNNCRQHICTHLRYHLFSSMISTYTPYIFLTQHLQTNVRHFYLTYCHSLLQSTYVTKCSIRNKNA